MKDKAAIFGAGGHCRVVASILRALKIPILGIFDDSFQYSEVIQGVPVIGRYDDILTCENDIGSVYLAIGDNMLRQKKYALLKKLGFETPPLIHPSALLADDVTIGEGTVVCMGATAGAEVEMGKGVILNTGCLVDHESWIGDFVHLAPRVTVAGRTRIESNVFVGINSCIADKLHIGKRAVVGAGSVVLRDVPAAQTVVGVVH